MRRSSIVILSCLLLALLPSTSAFSDGGKPERAPLNNESFTLDAGLGCEFAIAVDVVRDNETATTFPPDANGDVRTIVTGSLIWRVTNLDTLASVTRKISGPGTFIDHPDGSSSYDLKGANMLSFYPTDTPAGPLTIFNSGRWVIEVTVDGDFIEISRSGHSEDICAALS